jgi:hypothetical protein
MNEKCRVVKKGSTLFFLFAQNDTCLIGDKLRFYKSEIHDGHLFGASSLSYSVENRVDPILLYCGFFR